MVRLRLLKHANRIQGITLDQFLEKLAEGLPMSEALHPQDFPIDTKEAPDLGIHQMKGLQLIRQPVFLTFEKIGHGSGLGVDEHPCCLAARSFQISP